MRGPVRRGDIIIAAFRNARGTEIRKRRPYVVISPNELNEVSSTYLLAPMTTGHHPYRYRIPCRFAGREGHVVLDQIQSAHVSRTSKPVGKLGPAGLRVVLAQLRQMFEE